MLEFKILPARLCGVQLQAPLASKNFHRNFIKCQVFNKAIPNATVAPALMVCFTTNSDFYKRHFKGTDTQLADWAVLG